MEPYYYRGEKGTNIGPLELDELDRFHTSGIISDSTMIIEVGSDCWERYDVVCSNVIESLQAASEWTPPELPVDEIAPEQILIEGQTQFTEQALPQENYIAPEHTNLIVDESIPPLNLPTPTPAASPSAAPPSPTAEAGWMAAKVVYAAIIMSWFMVINGSSLSDLPFVLGVMAVLVAIGFVGQIADKRINLQYARGVKKTGWRKLTPVRTAKLFILVMGICFALGYASGMIRFG